MGSEKKRHPPWANTGNKALWDGDSGPRPCEHSLRPPPLPPFGPHSFPEHPQIDPRSNDFTGMELLSLDFSVLLP